MKTIWIIATVLSLSAAAVFSWVLWQRVGGASPSQQISPSSNEPAHQLMDRLRPLHQRLGPPQAGDWLKEHAERGQSYDEYVSGDPVCAVDKRRVLYIQPLGDFTSTQRKIVELTADFMARYFGLPVKIVDDLPLSKIPENARRVHPTWGMPQILSTYVIDQVLAPHLPDDAAAMIAFTASDLWPGQGWNFVFGQASLQSRVGVWSIYRNGDAEKGGDEFRLCLLRTLKTATHETGHMFSIQHCTAYECNMCGSNHREESDRKPLELCPECVAKIWHATGVDPLKRFQLLEEFCRLQGLNEDAEIYKKSQRAIRPDL